MGFLNPIFLMGILAAAVPLLIHLWSRRQARTVDFSSLMFLLVAHRQSVRRIQLKHLLILFLRMAIIALIAIALARPLLKNQFSFAGSRTKTSAVIILDNSYSMAYQGIDGKRFEAGVKSALEVVQSLRRGDSVALILMSNQPDAVFQKLTKDLNQVEDTLRQTEVSYQSTYVPASIEMAHDILSESNDPNREIYLIFDFGQNGLSNWGRMPNKSGARIFLLPVGDEVADNTSIEEVRLSNQLIGTKRPVRFHINASNHSDSSLEETTLTLFVDNQKRRAISTQIPARESISTTFTHNFQSPGTHTGYLELTEDRLNIDNRRYFAQPAYGQIRVLCVGEQTLYVTLALNPQHQQRPSTEYTILPVSCTPAEFDDFSLDDYDVLIWASVPRLTSRSEQQLQNFLRGGKSIIYFVDDGIDVSNYNQFSDWMPARLGPSVQWKSPLTVSEYQTDHAIFEVFQPQDFSGQYSPRFYRGLAIQPQDDATILAKFSDGTPFLVERAVDSGMILLFNASATRPGQASDLLVNPQFVPLLQQATLYTRGYQSRHERNLLVGQNYLANYRQNRATTASVRRIGDTHSPAVVSIAEDGSLAFAGTNAPGIYQVDIQGRDQLVRDFFAVNVDTAESDLSMVNIREAGDRIGAEIEVNVSTEGLEQTLNTYRMGREIWGELLVLALAFMLAETLLSNSERVVAGEANA